MGTKLSCLCAVEGDKFLVVGSSYSRLGMLNGVFWPSSLVMGDFCGIGFLMKREGVSKPSRFAAAAGLEVGPLIVRLY